MASAGKKEKKNRDTAQQCLGVIRWCIQISFRGSTTVLLLLHTQAKLCRLYMAVLLLLLLLQEVFFFWWDIKGRVRIIGSNSPARGPALHGPVSPLRNWWTQRQLLLLRSRKFPASFCLRHTCPSIRNNSHLIHVYINTTTGLPTIGPAQEKKGVQCPLFSSLRDRKISPREKRRRRWIPCDSIECLWWFPCPKVEMLIE
jgi:hypothetical protein